MMINVRIWNVPFFLLTSSVIIASSNSELPPHVPGDKSWETRMVSGGAPVTLKCPVVDEGGHIFYRWYRGDREISRSLDDQFKVVGHSSKKLIIKNFSHHLQGNYSCKGVNGFGNAVFSFLLHHGDTRISVESILAENVLVNQTVDEGARVVMSCRVQSLEMWHVRWGKLHKQGHGEMVQSSLIEIGNKMYQPIKPGKWVLTDEKFMFDKSFEHSLILLSVKESDTGQYICVVYNKDSPLSYQTAYLSVNPTIRIETPQNPHQPQNTRRHVPQMTHETEEEVASISDLTIVLAVLGSIVILLLVVLAGLLLNTSKRKKIVSLYPAEASHGSEKQKIRFNLEPEDHTHLKYSNC